MSALVSVVVPTTTQRTGQLQRALQSVYRQDDARVAEIVVVTDEGTASQVSNSLPYSTLSALKIVEVEVPGSVDDRELFSVSGAARIARKRNAGVRASCGRYIAHLDDDNEWRPGHIAALLETLKRTPAAAAHSWRTLHWPDGRAYSEPLYPWLKVPSSATSAYIYAELVKKGVLERGTNRVRDGFLGSDGEPLLTVDSSEWMLDRELADAVLYVEDLDFRQVSHHLSDDFLFCQRLLGLGVVPACSEMFSLKYYLGGRSSGWLMELSRD